MVEVAHGRNLSSSFIALIQTVQSCCFKIKFPYTAIISTCARLPFSSSLSPTHTAYPIFLSFSSTHYLTSHSSELLSCSLHVEMSKWTKNNMPVSSLPEMALKIDCQAKLNTISSLSDTILFYSCFSCSCQMLKLILDVFLGVIIN